MALDFWTKTSGTWINLATVLVGTTIGLLLQSRLPQSMQQIITQGIGLLTLWLGFSLTGQLSAVQAGVLIGLIALILGGILGEWWGIEQKLTDLGNWLKWRLKGKGRFTEGFVAASLLFCVGPMTLIGSINNGLTGDNTLLVIKAMMDGLVSIPFASSYGIGVGFSSLVILVYQGGLSLLAGELTSLIVEPANNPQIMVMTGVGGLMIIGIGLGLLEIAKIRVASFVPAIVLAPILSWLVQFIS